MHKKSVERRNEVENEDAAKGCDKVLGKKNCKDRRIRDRNTTQCTVKKKVLVHGILRNNSDERWTKHEG